MSYCTNCGASLVQIDKFCSACGTENKPFIIESEEKNSEGTSLVGEKKEFGTSYQSNLNSENLSKYYQQEFKMIQESNEEYQGKFNIAAFIGGPLWAFVKGLYLPALIAIIVSVLTAGIGGVVYWFVFGIRGNWMIYNWFGCQN